MTCEFSLSTPQVFVLGKHDQVPSYIHDRRHSLKVGLHHCHHAEFRVRNRAYFSTVISPYNLGTTIPWNACHKAHVQHCVTAQLGFD